MPPNSTPHLPPPQTFDLLPALHELLSRIDQPETGPSGGISFPHQPVDPSDSNNTDLPALYNTNSDTNALEPKDLPSEILPLKRLIRQALRELEKLPDMDREVDEQGREMERLERRIARQREVLRGLGRAAASGNAGLGMGVKVEER